MFAVQALKRWSPGPGPSLRLFGIRRFAPSGGVEAMLCGSNASGFVAINAFIAINFFRIVGDGES